jgi:hypothetical protein
MSNLTQDILFLILLAFITQYFLVPMITVKSYSQITNSLSKIYLSTIVATMIAFLYVIIYDFNNGSISCNYYIGLGIIIGTLTYAYRNGLGVTYYDWANWMAEHQSAGILVSEPILSSQPQNQTQTQTQNIASDIISTQNQQINSLKQLISQMKTNGVYY